MEFLIKFIFENDDIAEKILINICHSLIKTFDENRNIRNDNIEIDNGIKSTQEIFERIEKMENELSSLNLLSNKHISMVENNSVRSDSDVIILLEEMDKRIKENEIQSERMKNEYNSLISLVNKLISNIENITMVNDSAVTPVVNNSITIDNIGIIDAVKNDVVEIVSDTNSMELNSIELNSNENDFNTKEIDNNTVEINYRNMSVKEKVKVVEQWK